MNCSKSELTKTCSSESPNSSEETEEYCSAEGSPLNSKEAFVVKKSNLSLNLSTLQMAEHTDDENDSIFVVEEGSTKANTTYTIQKPEPQAQPKSNSSEDLCLELSSHDEDEWEDIIVLSSDASNSAFEAASIHSNMTQTETNPVQAISKGQETNQNNSPKLSLINSSQISDEKENGLITITEHKVTPSEYREESKAR